MKAFGMSLSVIKIFRTNYDNKPKMVMLSLTLILRKYCFFYKDEFL